MKQIAVGALSLALLAGCSSAKAEAKTIDVVSENMAFASKEITVAKGQPVKLVLDNKDGLLHDFSIDKIPVKVVEAAGHDAHEMGSHKPDLHASAAAGKKSEVLFTPTKAGTYEFYCTVPGHKDAGMVGKLIVL